MNHENSQVAMKPTADTLPPSAEAVATKLSSTTPPQVVQIAPGDLRPHPLNIKLYGQEVLDNEFVNSVGTLGVLTPLLATKEKIVLSGHRRLQAAKEAHLAAVPVVIIEGLDEIGEQERILEANRSRHKGNEQRIREFMAYERIETVKAKRRAGQRADLLPNSAGGKVKGSARDIAAARVGMAGSTAADGEKIISLIDGGKKSVTPDQRQQLRKVLKERSIHAAYKKAEGLGLITPKPRPKKESPSKETAQSAVITETPGDVKTPQPSPPSSPELAPVGSADDQRSQDSRIVSPGVVPDVGDDVESTPATVAAVEPTAAPSIAAPDQECNREAPSQDRKVTGWVVKKQMEERLRDLKHHAARETYQRCIEVINAVGGTDPSNDLLHRIVEGMVEAKNIVTMDCRYILGRDD